MVDFDGNIIESDMDGMTCKMKPPNRGPRSNSGVIVGQSGNGECWIIQWADLKGTRAFHKSFIEMVGPIEGTTDPEIEKWADEVFRSDA